MGQLVRRLRLRLAMWVMPKGITCVTMDARQVARAVTEYTFKQQGRR